MNGLYIKTNVKTPSDDTPEQLKRHKEAKNFLEKKIVNMEACLVEILENNPEQAEALMKDLGIEWEKSVPPEQKN